MASFSDEVGPRDAGSTSGRRDFLRKAGVVGTGAFVVPMIITVDPADAQALNSPPPEAPGRPESPRVDVGGGTASPPGTQQGTRATGTRVTRRTELPRTGADLDRLVAAGLAATAGGTALVLWSAEAKCAGAKSSDSASET
jgi:hypothetical protein